MPREERTKLIAEAFQNRRYQDVCAALEETQPSTDSEWAYGGRAWIAQGEVTRALDWLRQGVSAFPESLQLQFYVAVAHAKSGDWKQTEAAIADCVENSEWRAKALAVRAQARMLAGFHARAADDYAALEDIGGLRPRHYLAMALCCVKRSQPKRALPLLEKLFASGAASELGFVLLGRCWERMHEPDKAAASYRDGLAKYRMSDTLAERLCRLSISRTNSPVILLEPLATREKVRKKWLGDLRKAPADLKLVHRLAILCANQARHNAGRKNQTEGEEVSRAAVSFWSVLLSNRDWQHHFVNTRCEVYDYKPTKYEDREFAKRGNQLFGDIVEDARNVRTRPGQPSVPELALRERVATDAVAELLVSGGFALPPARVPVACGPDYLRIVESEEPFSTLLGETRAGKTSEWATWPDPGLIKTPERTLKWLFSSAGFALARLIRKEPEFAIEALKWCLCRDCAARSGTAGEIEVCATGCDRLRENNASLDDEASCEAELRDAVRIIRLHAHVLRGRLAISVAEPRSKEMEQQWSLALQFVPAEYSDQLARHLRSTALGRAETLVSERRYNPAIQVLEAALSLWPGQKGIVVPLTIALTNYGTMLSNKAQYAEALPPLRRALELAPDLANARRSYVLTLRDLAFQLEQKQQGEEAMELCDDGIEYLVEVGRKSWDDDLRGGFWELQTTKMRAQMSTAAQLHSEEQDADAAGVLKQAIESVPAEDEFGSPTAEFLSTARKCAQYWVIACGNAARRDPADADHWRTEEMQAAKALAKLN